MIRDNDDDDDDGGTWAIIICISCSSFYTSPTLCIYS
jgi:hypothetical protein